MPSMIAKTSPRRLTLVLATLVGAAAAFVVVPALVQSKTEAQARVVTPRGALAADEQANVELFAELHDVPKADRSERALRATETVGLAGFEGHYPQALSGGMRMRASIARSLMMEPPVFLFDEPFGALDEITREKLQTELIRLFMDNGFAGLFITHSITEAVYLSTRVLVMSSRPGRITADIEIPFAYPRSPELRFDPAFAELAGHVSEELRNAH